MSFFFLLIVVFYVRQRRGALGNVLICTSADLTLFYRLLGRSPRLAPVPGGLRLSPAAPATQEPAIPRVLTRSAICLYSSDPLTTRIGDIGPDWRSQFSKEAFHTTVVQPPVQNYYSPLNVSLSFLWGSYYSRGSVPGVYLLVGGDAYQTMCSTLNSPPRSAFVFLCLCIVQIEPFCSC